MHQTLTHHRTGKSVAGWLTLSLVLIAVTSLTAPRSGAQTTLYWDTNGATAGSSGANGTWGTSLFWTTDSAGTSATTGYTQGRDTVFSAGSNANGAYTVTVSGTRNTSSITVEEGTVNFSGGTINFNDATPDFTVNTGLTTTVNSIIAGSNGLTKAGAGTLTLSGSNSYTGATRINAGTLRLQSNNALGTTANTANTTVAGGASLQLTNSITTANRGTLILSGTGSGPGALQSISGNNTWNSGLTLAANTSIFSSTAGNTLTIGNASGASLFSMGANTVTFDGPGNTWINSNVGVAGDTGGLIKNGTGKLTLFGYNTYYTGATNVNAGSLDLIVGPFNAGVYGIMGALTIGTGPSNPALAGTVNVNIASNSYANQISPTSAVAIYSDGALNVGSSTGLGALTLSGGRVNVNNGIAISPTSVASAVNSAHQTALISGGQLSLAGATSFTVARDAALASDLTVSSTITGGSIVKQGTGILTLSATNTLTGASIDAGAINAQAGNALGTTNGVTVAGGAALQVQGGVSLGHASTLLNGTGLAGTGALRNISGNNTLTGGIALGSASLVSSDAGMLTLAGGLTTAGNDLTVGGAGNTTFAGTLAFGSTTLTKTDAGILTFNSTLDLSGGTLLLNAGTLALNGTTLNVGTLHITGDSILDFGSTSTLNATNFVIDAGVSLTIANWSDAVDYFYAQNWSGAVPDAPGSAPMNQITFTGFSNNSTRWLSFGRQVTPVPEPATYGASLMALSALSFAWYCRRTKGGDLTKEPNLLPEPDRAVRREPETLRRNHGTPCGLSNAADHSRVAFKQARTECPLHL